jgi:hypothetical protein
MVRQLYPDGVDAALELVGTPTLPDTLRSVRIHGTVCFTGLLSNQWTVKEFYPIDYIPAGVRLTAYEGSATDLPREAMQRVLDAVADGTLPITVHHVYDGLEQVRQAHSDMENNTATANSWSESAAEVECTAAWRTAPTVPVSQGNGSTDATAGATIASSAPQPRTHAAPQGEGATGPAGGADATSTDAHPSPNPGPPLIRAGACCWSGVTDGGAGHHYCLSRTTNRFPTTRQR